jgi:tetratricopeptide (TPR) repeat protein
VSSAVFAIALQTSPRASAEIPSQLPHDPTHAENAIEWCARHLARGELVQALSDCDYAIARNSNSVAALSNRGSVYLIAGEFTRAIVDFDSAIALAPTDPDLHFNRGIAYGKLGKSELAIRAYTVAIELRPGFAIAYHNRGYEYELLSRFDDALSDYGQAVAAKPDLKPSSLAIERIRRANRR